MTSLKARMTQGNIVSWVTGILLGLILGVALSVSYTHLTLPTKRIV